MQFSEVNEAENSGENTGNNITAEDLEALYYDYLQTGSGGEECLVLTNGVSLIIEDGSSPQEKAKEIIEEFLNIKNILI